MHTTDTVTEIKDGTFLVTQVAAEGKRASAPREGAGRRWLAIAGVAGQALLQAQRLLGVAAFLLLWEIAPRLGLIDATFIPSFTSVVTAWFALAGSGDLFHHVVASLERSAIGFGLALVLGLPLGLLIGWFKKVEFYLDPLLQVFRQTSILSLFPVFILLFGIGEVSKISIVFWGAGWPILLNTISGVRNMDPLLVKSARSMGASQLTIFRHVVLPASIPSILAGVRLSATFSIIVLTGAEMLGANAGLGFLVFDSQAKFRIPEMFAAIITMSLLGLILNYGIVYVEKRVARWKDGLSVGG